MKQFKASVFIALIAFNAIVFYSCKKQDGLPINKPIADFSFTVENEIKSVSKVIFTNTSKYANKYLWMFGDGDTSSVPNPEHIYLRTGVYYVKLIVSNAYGIDSITKLVDLTVAPYSQVYTAFNGNVLNLFAWEGNKVMILSRKSDLNRIVMYKWLKAMDTTYGYYKSCTGRDPATLPQTYINNRTTIADVPATCGAGCAYLGFTGIEMQNTYFDIMYNAINNNDEYDQVAFYEFGRNFWFYGNKLAYKANDPVTTGYAVFMRFMAMNAAGVKGAPFGSLSFSEFQNRVIELIDLYLNNPSLNWNNTLGANQGVPGAFGGATDLFASFCFRLKRDYGGETFVKNVWKQAELRPDANSTQDAVDNFFLASCAAANKNLTVLFQSWRWPLSAKAISDALQYP